MKEIYVNGKDLKYSVQHYSGESAISTHSRTNFYYGTDVTERRKYYMFGPKIKVEQPHFVFALPYDIEDPRFSKDAIRTAIESYIEYYKRKDEILRGELV